MAPTSDDGRPPAGRDEDHQTPSHAGERAVDVPARGHAGGAAAVGPNALADGLEQLPVPPTVMVIFGVTGDLASRKLLPALYNLAHGGSLPDRFELVGFGRQDLGGRGPDDDTGGFEGLARRSIEAHSRVRPQAGVLDGLLERVAYVRGTFDDDDAYEALGRTLEDLDEAAGTPLRRLFYLSTAPRFFPVIVDRLGAHGLARRDAADSSRVVIEKPFGTTLAEADELNRRVLAVLDESQVFRIDHYLGKETVQNLLALRFANGLFEPLWNRDRIASVQITAAEDVGVGSRAGYYDTSGALRDLVQNHLLQLLCLLAMEPPNRFEADEIRTEKVKVLRAIRPPAAEEIGSRAVRGRYGAGAVGGEEVHGYLDEQDVPEDSRTETFAALRLEIDTWRWAGVPFYLRTGKRLGRKVTEIAVTLRPVPHLAFDAEGAEVEPNQIVFALQPDERVTMRLAAKVPGAGMQLRPVSMEFGYGSAFLSESPEAYERLITDAMRGEATLFTRADEVHAQWRIIDPILEAWERLGIVPETYAAGTDGPDAQDAVLRYGDRWRAL